MTGRPTRYRGTRMRSRLEADFAALLDHQGRSWEYEPTCFGNERGQWLPDFGTPGRYRGFYIEVKPLTDAYPRLGETPEEAVGRISLLCDRMAITWASEPDAGLLLVFHEFGHRSLSWEAQPFVIAIGTDQVWRWEIPEQQQLWEAA